MNRRRLLILPTYLALGAAINIAIAWIAVARGSFISIEGQSVRPPTARPDDPMSGWGAPIHLDWPWPVPADWPPLQVRTRSYDFGLMWEEATDNDGHDLNVKTHSAGGIRAGWPWKSMSWMRCNIRDQGAEIWTTTPNALPPFRSSMTAFGTMNGPLPRRLPLTPIWPAFIANTLLYSLASAALILTPLAAFRTHRRAKRRRAGKCTTCAYPLHGTTCPECGATTNASTPA